MAFKTMHRNHAGGFALIEALISMVVMAIALKGIGDYWMKTVKESEHNFSRSQALIVAQNIIEFVRVNPDGWTTYKNPKNCQNSNLILKNKCFSASANNLNKCSPADMAFADIYFIKDYVSKNMPLMNGSLEMRSPCNTGGKIACVIVAWMDTTAEQCNPLNDGTQFFKGNLNAANNPAGYTQCIMIDFIPEHATAS